MSSTDRLCALRNVAAALALPTFPGVAHADSLLAQALFVADSHTEQQSSAYEVEADGARFSFDKASGAPLVAFKGSREVFALTEQQGPRGDQLYKTDHGYTLLRVTTNRSVIVYGAAYPTGAPASLIGEALPIAPPAPLKGDLRDYATQTAAKVTKIAGREVVFSLPPSAQTESGFFAEAIDRAADGIVMARASLPRQPNFVVKIIVAKSATAALSGSELRVGVNPLLGYEGRPSSQRVSQAITRAQAIGAPTIAFSFVSMK